MPLRAKVSPDELAAYLSTHPKPETFHTPINPIVELVSKAKSVGDLPKKSTALAAQWNISRNAADNLVELVVIQDGGNSGRNPATRARLQGLVAQLHALAPDSPPAWQVILWYLQETESCETSGLKSIYFKKPWAPNDYLRRNNYSCAEWLYSLPRFSQINVLFYARLASESHAFNSLDYAGQIAAARALRDSLRQEHRPVDDSARLFAERHYLKLLAEQGLVDRLLSEGHSLPDPDLQVILNGRADSSATLDGYEFEDVRYAGEVARSLQTQWILALLAANRRLEAQRWSAEFHSPISELPAFDRAQAQADRDALRIIVADSKEDGFDMFLSLNESMESSREIMGSRTGRSVLVTYLSRTGYEDLAAYLRSLPCFEPDNEDTPTKWESFPAAFRTAQAEIKAEIERSQSGDRSCTHGRGGNPRQVPPRPEFPMPANLRTTHAPDESPVIPAVARAALAPFRIIRYSSSGSQTAALSLSQYVDPTGEVSGGGYWLHLSADGGRTWKPPLYLGLQQYLPYTAVAQSKLPLVKDRTLQIEVEVREIDLSRLTFPPVGLTTKREARDLYITMQLDEIEKDSDADGLTDILEAKLGTNPLDPDTDHDGIRDDVDPIPQASRTAPPIPDSEVLRMALETALGYDKKAIHTGGPATQEERTASVIDCLIHPSSTSTGGRTPTVMFVEGDAALFTGINVPQRIVILTPEQVEKIRARFGLFYPISFRALFNHSHTEALVIWSASWAGGNMTFKKKQGRWQPPAHSDWIT